MKNNIFNPIGNQKLKINEQMKLGKYSFGIGDRFAQEGKAQLRAIIKASNNGIDIHPVWNKSNREHQIVHTHPSDVRTEADEAVKNLGYKGKYFVDADHINLGTVEPFITGSDFFTLDVAAYIGNESSSSEISEFIESCSKYKGELFIPGIQKPFQIDDGLLTDIAGRFLKATDEASKIYSLLKEKKGDGNFITEVSMDEVEAPQTPVDLFFILKMLADKNVPVQTIAPKFTGRFNKGVDYVGDVDQFTKEFESDVLVIAYAISEFGLPEELKLSVHSGSDKFSIYPIMGEIIRKHDCGLHVKTAGTTWLEEVIGLAKAGGTGLEAAKSIYSKALARKEELCAPYSDVIDIDEKKLPSVEEVNRWDSETYANTLRHIPDHPQYNPNFRQLIHVGYKVAAEMGEEYYNLLGQYSDVIGECVEENIYERHIKRLFSL